MTLTVVVILNMLFYIDTILILDQCNPVWKQWTFDYEGGSCWDPSVLATFGIMTGAIGCASDFVLALIPWFNILELQMNMQTKIGVGFTLSAGLFAGCCSVLKVYYTTRLISRTDYACKSIISGVYLLRLLIFDLMGYYSARTVEHCRTMSDKRRCLYSNAGTAVSVHSPQGRILAS